MNYTIDTTVDEPIMLINREIGEDYGMIDGALFQEELMQLDTMGKKRIQVWINSPGGQVLNGMNIYNAILKSKTPVDTYCVGIAASIAGAIFMAGRKRYMADYGRLMMHPVQGSADSKAYESLMSSIATMLQAKSKCNEDEVNQMMTATTWMTASQCFEKGFCTDIENTNTSNSKYAKHDATALWAVANTLILNKTNKKMKQVTNVLNLNEDASEASIAEAVNALKSANNTLTSNNADLQSQLDAAKQNVIDIQAKLDASISEVETAKAEVVENNAKELIKSFSNKIGTDETNVAKWVNLAKNDLEGTKSILEGLPLNVVAPKQKDAGNETAPKMTAQSVMAEINARNQNKN